jgi:hypothetical protein
MKLKFLAPALLAGFVAFTSCSKDDKKEEKKEEKVVLDFSGNEVKEVQLSTLTGWKYFSFKNGEVTPANPAEDLTWDIALKLYYVKLNGGTSGKGKAEALKVEETDFSKVTEIPKAEFVKDTEGELTLGRFPNLIKEKASFSQLLSGGMGTKTGIIGLDPTKAPKVFVPTNHIYILKTADGTYVKLQVTDFYKNEADVIGGSPKLKFQLSKTQSK